MPQIFHPSTNALARASLAAGGLLTVGLLVWLGVIARSPVETGVNQPVPQPVAFSHRHHVGEEGFDCRYCHTTVDTAAFAGMPSPSLCMNCHREIFSNSPKLALVFNAVENDVPIAWNRVNDLPDFVYFDHQAHVTHGVGCETCHGRVDQMSGMWQAQPLLMTWCLDCHRDPAKYVRPLDAVEEMGYVPAEDQAVLGPQLVAQLDIHSLTDCTTCHR
jgi:hypothetical protein